MSWLPASDLTPRHALIGGAGERVTGQVVAVLAVVAVAASVGALSLARDRGATPALSPRPAAAAFSGLIAGAPLQRARCWHWRAATPAERQGAIASLAQVVGGRSTTGGYGTTLDASAATALFDRQCAISTGRTLLLYEIYIRAAAFN
jgi:hypothetical protein